MKRNYLFTLWAFAIGAQIAFGQVDSLKGDINFRTRSEFDNGYKSLYPESKKTETTIYSRARLGLNYYYQNLEIRFSAQDVRSWGDTETANAQNEHFTVHEAWAKYQFNTNIGLKVGRQVLSYDDERLIGALDWAMQGRSFDALKGSFLFKNQSKLEAVVTYNNDNDATNNTPTNEFYQVVEAGERTKSLQILHYQFPQFNTFNLSVIAVNNVVQDSTAHHNSMSTLGVNFKNVFSEKFALYGSGYYQFGENSIDQNKNAYQFSLNLSYQAFTFWNATLGGEILSGTSYNEDLDDNNSFSPMYGTNHKFNGYMDYFFAGNYFNSFGLNDFYLNNKFSLNKSNVITAGLHYFGSNAEIAPDRDKYLGTEIDLVYTGKISPSFSINLGYSQMFASDNLDYIKNVANPQDFQSWGWISLNFVPRFKLL